jgi:type VI secretion system protein ImpH
MGAAMRGSTDHLSYFHQLNAAPYRADFFHALRRIECLFPDKPRIGRALRPVDEPLRMGQEPSLAFAPATVSAFMLPTGTRPARMEIRFMGLLGPNGPLPLHLTEYARERQFNAGDPTFPRFLDIFNHRFFALFYRAWAQAQPAVSLDRPREDRFAAYVGSLFGLGSAKLLQRDAVADHAKLFFAGHLARQVRNPDGLAQILSGYFRLPVQVESFVGHWMELDDDARTRLGRRSAALGAGAVAGRKVWDRQHKFRIRMGPLTLAQYENFLPGGAGLERLTAWVRQYLCFELDWDVRLALSAPEVPRTALGRQRRLGWTTWIGKRKKPRPAEDLTLDPERLAARQQRLRRRGVEHG